MAAVSCACWNASGARAASSLRLETSGFLKHAENSGDSLSSLILAPDLAWEGSAFSARLEGQAITFLRDASSFTVEAANAYLATSRNLMPLHQITAGRRVYDWSRADDAWKLGLWSPRFNWDPMRPETLGLTGFFYSYESRNWRVLAYASPISVPERGVPVREEDGKLVSASRFWIQPYERIRLINQDVDIHYAIRTPDLQELLLNPSTAVSARFREGRYGWWASGGYGILPVHQPDIAVDPGYSLSKGVMEVDLHPRVLSHHVLTAESGYDTRDWSVWASLSGESPLGKAAPARWMTEPVGPAILLSTGFELRPMDDVQVAGSYLTVSEDKPEPEQKSDLDLDLPSRFPFTRAWQLGARYTGISDLAYDIQWTMDVGDSSHLFSFDVTYQPERRGGWTFGLGTDFFTSTTGRGLIGQFDGNDRVRGRISYAF